ncbi:MAG: thiamine phosphate synthase [Hyphomicrobiales bacterium]
MNSPRCQLYLRVPVAAKPEAARGCLAAALEAGEVAALLVPQAEREESTVSMLQALGPFAQERGVAVVLAGPERLAQRHGADGVEVSDRTDYDAARKTLGASAIVGADCERSRHFAMEMAEAGADYVGFANAADGGLDLVAWWGELFEVPCVARDPAEPGQAGALARLGADFVRPVDAMWASPAEARKIIADTLRAIEEVAR